MKNFKTRTDFIKESVELTVNELETKKLSPNWKFNKNFPEKNEGDILVHKGDRVYYDEPGKRLVVLGGFHDRMIVDLELGELQEYADRIDSDNSNKPFRAIKVMPNSRLPGIVTKLADAIEGFHNIAPDMESSAAAYYSLDALNDSRPSISPKEFRSSAEEEARRLEIKVKVEMVKLVEKDGGLTEV